MQKLQDEYCTVAGKLALYQLVVEWAIRELEGLENGLDKSGTVVVTAKDLRRVASGLYFVSEGNE